MVPAEDGDDEGVPGPCPYCRASVTTSSLGESLESTVWRCACGAVGAGVTLWADLDEAAGDLLLTLGIDASILPPSQPVGTSGMIQARPILPPDEVQASLERLLGPRGYTVARAEWTQGRWKWLSLWARGRVAKMEHIR